MKTNLLFLLDILRIIKFTQILKTNKIIPEIIKSEIDQSISSVKFIPINGINNNKSGKKTFLDIFKNKKTVKLISLTVLSFYLLPLLDSNQGPSD